MKKVLIVEDDRHIVDLLTIHLHDMHCKVTKKYDGREGLHAGLEHKFDLIILDIMLPSMDGFDICRKLRAANVQTPILMLTARSEEIDTVLGLETGADDFMTKPFGVREFIARVKAIFRRMEMMQGSTEHAPIQQLKHGALHIDIDKRKVTIEQERIDLTPKEFDLLVLLASHPGKSYSREQILRLVWGFEFEGYEHTVNSHINRLRAKIEPNISKPSYILTTWGIGYRFTDE